MSRVIAKHQELLEKFNIWDFIGMVKCLLNDDKEKYPDFMECFEHYQNEEDEYEFLMSLISKVEPERHIGYYLECFVKMLLKNLKKNSDLTYLMCDIVDKMLGFDCGPTAPDWFQVSFPTKILIQRTHTDAVTLGTEIEDYWTRGVLLDEFEPEDVEEHINNLEFFKTEDVRWKDIVAVDPDTLDLEKECTEWERLSVLKYYSEYLQGTRWMQSKNN